MTTDPIVDDSGILKGYIAINKDVTEKIQKMKDHQETIEMYEIVTKATSDTIWDADLIEDTVTYNSNIYDVFGYDIDDVGSSGDWWLNKIHPDDREQANKVFERAEREKKGRIQVEYRFQCADGSYKYINDRAFIINNEEGTPVRMIGAMQDVTQQKEENMWLKLLESAIANSTEAIAILGKKTDDAPARNVLYVNEAFERLTGFSKKNVVGNSLLEYIGPRTSRRKIIEGIRALDRGESFQLELSYTDKSKNDKWINISFAPVKNSEENSHYWICIGTDTTERRNREQKLRESLQEKETLLMEIHHRVKNNLAVVSSMMQLQAMDEQNKAFQTKLYDSVSRIRTMVTIHEMLYQSGSFAKLDFAENLKNLVSMIIKTIQSTNKITVDFECDEVQLNVNQAIPSSLIVNEIVTNCIKHAFNGNEDGRIYINLKERKNEIMIIVSDNGIGLPEDFDESDTSSLGMQLIKVLTEQMEAEYNYSASGESGTRFEMKFERSSVKGIGNAHLN